MIILRFICIASLWPKQLTHGSKLIYIIFPSWSPFDPFQISSDWGCNSSLAFLKYPPWVSYWILYHLSCFSDLGSSQFDNWFWYGRQTFSLILYLRWPEDSLTSPTLGWILRRALIFLWSTTSFVLNIVSTTAFIFIATVGNRNSLVEAAVGRKYGLLIRTRNKRLKCNDGLIKRKTLKHQPDGGVYLEWFFKVYLKSKIL